jgi:hypothetical protein
MISLGMMSVLGPVVRDKKPKGVHMGMILMEVPEKAQTKAQEANMRRSLINRIIKGNWIRELTGLGSGNEENLTTRNDCFTIKQVESGCFIVSELKHKWTSLIPRWKIWQRGFSISEWVKDRIKLWRTKSELTEPVGGAGVASTLQTDGKLMEVMECFQMDARRKKEN